jgi:NTE family protein
MPLDDTPWQDLTALNDPQRPLMRGYPLPRIGLALGAGVARGFAHVGVIRALARHGIKPDVIAGTSIGAVVGGVYLASRLDEFEDWALSLNRRKLFGYLDFTVRSPGIIVGKKFTGALEEHLKGIQIADLPHPFIAIATDVATGHEVWLRRGPLIEAMRASFAMPGIFPPVQINGQNLIDGALVNPTPVSACRALGAKVTIAVDLNADLIGKVRKADENYQKIMGFDVFNDQDVSPEDQKIFKKYSFTEKLFKREENAPSLFGVMFSSLNIVLDRITRSRLAGDPPDIHIKPLVGRYGLLEVDKAKDMILEGENAVERILPEIKSTINTLLSPDERPKIT